MSEAEKVEGIVLISDPSRSCLNERQLIAYKNHRKELVKWLSQMGKDPDKLEGYAYDTAKNYASIIDKFHREVWDEEGYTTDISHDNADSYLRNMVLSSKSVKSRSIHQRESKPILKVPLPSCGLAPNSQ